MENKFKKAFDLVKRAKNVLLVCHYDPDGDALSSVCALGLALEKLGIKNDFFCYNKYPSQYYFLPGIEKFKYLLDERMNPSGFNLDFDQYDLIIVCDCGSLDRTQLAKQISSRSQNQRIIEFDHHLKVDDYSDLELRNERAAATTEVIYDFLRANKIKIDNKIAECILTGLVTDTGTFLHGSTSDKVIKISSEMLEKGANLNRIIDNTWRNKSLRNLKIWGKVMERLQINLRYNLAFTFLTHEDIKKDNISKGEMDGLAGFLGNLQGVNALMFLREEEKGVIKGSLRSSKDFDVSRLANALGGGGHKRASGFSVKGKLTFDAQEGLFIQ